MTSARPLAVVTGARRGIGAACALELARSGFDLALTDISEEGAAPTLEALRACGVQVALISSDLSNIDEHGQVIAQIVAQQGPIHCLVNNAGITAKKRGDLLEIEADSFDHVLNTNLRGTFFFTQHTARHMITTTTTLPRSIITISSVSATLASPSRGEYCLSKAGLAMMTKLFALRLATHAIGVFEVRPGIIRTEMTAAVATDYERRIAEGLVPARRWGEVDDVAHSVALLASRRLSFATGSVLQVDGGLSIAQL